MGRKTLAGVIVLALLVLAGQAVAAEKVDNVFIVGFDAGYFGYTGWMGEQFTGSVGGNLFFGYGITENFSMQIDYYPLIMTTPDGDEVEDAFDQAYWGGIAQVGDQFGGFGISGKLYPRGRFREVDFLRVQPFLTLGAGTIPFIWAYTDEVADLSGEDYDGFNAVYANFGGGIDFMLAKWFSINLHAKLWRYFMYGDTLQGYEVDDDLKTDVEGSMAYQVGLGLTFQW